MTTTALILSLALSATRLEVTSGQEFRIFAQSSIPATIGMTDAFGNTISFEDTQAVAFSFVAATVKEPTEVRYTAWAEAGGVRVSQPVKIIVLPSK